MQITPQPSRLEENIYHWWHNILPKCAEKIWYIILKFLLLFFIAFNSNRKGPPIHKKQFVGFHQPRIAAL